MDRQGNGCEQLEGPIHFRSLDRAIKETETNIEYLKYELKSREAQLNEYKKVRKLVTPELEAAVKALKGVGLV